MRILTQTQAHYANFMLNNLRENWAKGEQCLTLLSSNTHKLAEFQRFQLPGIAIKTGPDLRELDNEAGIVAAHKACQNGNRFLIDDTLLEIDDKEIIDIRYCMDNLDQFENLDAKWIVNLAFAHAGSVYVFTGVTEGKIVKPIGNSGFGFDPFFEPNETPGQTLALLEQQGKKDTVSARRKAVEAVLTAEPILTAVAIDIMAIDGPWQT